MPSQSKSNRTSLLLVAFVSASIALIMGACGSPPVATPDGSRLFTGMKLIDGTGRAPMDNAAMLVRDGRIETIGPADDIPVPEGAEVISLTGKTVTPGFIITHAHLSGVRGLEDGHYNEENLMRQLRLYARYGMTTVVSLGGDGPEAVALRDAQGADLDRARVFLAGSVVTGESIEEVEKVVQENADLGADFIKIRVDDNLGTTQKMPIELASAIIAKAHSLDLKVMAHVFYLDDAKALLESGVDFIAHSVRDQEIDEEFIAAMKEKDVCYCPTLTREVSTFVYGEVPEFFEDPFFLKEADLEVLEQLKDPDRMRSVQESPAAAGYRAALDVAMANLTSAADGGVRIAFGTDTGPAGRFQGYFEHMEMDMMAETGLSATDIVYSATGGAASCLELDDLGKLVEGNWADFIVVDEDPSEDISHMRAIASVWVSGNRVP